MINKKLSTALRIVISLGLLGFLIYRNRSNFNSILDAIKDLNIYYLVVAFVLIPCIESLLPPHGLCRTNE